MAPIAGRTPLINFSLMTYRVAFVIAFSCGVPAGLFSELLIAYYVSASREVPIFPPHTLSYHH